MFHRNLIYKWPPQPKLLRVKYPLHKRYLAGTLHEQHEARKVFSNLENLNEELLNCSDSDDESDIEDDIEAFENLYIEYTCEKIDDPTMEAENNPIAFTINDIVGDPADHYKFRTKSHIRREFLIRVKVNGVSRSYPNNPHNPLPRLAFSPETLPLVVLSTTTRCRRVDRELALSWISLMD
jgi:hypothetical protein